MDAMAFAILVGFVQRTDLRSKEVQNIIQNILALDAVSLHNILDIQFAV